MGGKRKERKEGKGRNTHFPNTSLPLPTAVAKDGIKNGCTDLRQLRSYAPTLANFWLRHMSMWRVGAASLRGELVL